MNDVQIRIRDTMNRLTLDDVQFANYVGVSVHTLTKWLNGTRTPSSCTVRLLDVLGTIEALAPMIHAGFLPDKSAK